MAKSTAYSEFPKSPKGLLSLAQIVSRLEQEHAWPLSPCAHSPLQTGWIEFIGRYHWQWFGTFTFRDEVHPEKADKLFRYWCARIDEANLGSRWFSPAKVKQRLQWVRGLEWQKRGVLHYHALIGNLPPFKDGHAVRVTSCDLWNEIAGFALIHPVTSLPGVAAYIAKYCAKGGEVDICPSIDAQLRLLSGPRD